MHIMVLVSISFNYVTKKKMQLKIWRKWCKFLKTNKKAHPRYIWFYSTFTLYVYQMIISVLDDRFFINCVVNRCARWLMCWSRCWRGSLKTTSSISWCLRQRWGSFCTGYWCILGNLSSIMKKLSRYVMYIGTLVIIVRFIVLKVLNLIIFVLNTIKYLL